MAEVKARLATQDKVRKNAVLAVEILHWARPQSGGAENVIAVTRHI